MSSTLMQLHSLYKSVPPQWPMAGLSMLAASMAPDLKHAFLLHFWVSYLMGFGGGLVTSLLIMDPVKAPIAMLSSNTFGITFAVCWWLINYSPFNVGGRIHSLWPCKTLTKACANFCKASLIVARVDLAVRMYPGVIAAPLILGTLAGSSGKFAVDLARHLLGSSSAAAPPELCVPTAAWWTAFLSALTYYLTTTVFQLLQTQEAAALIITLLVGQSLLSDLTGFAVDISFPVAYLAHTFSLIPKPVGTSAVVVKQQGTKTNGSTTKNSAISGTATSGTEQREAPTKYGLTATSGPSSITQGNKAEADGKKKRM